MRCAGSPVGLLPSSAWLRRALATLSAGRLPGLRAGAPHLGNQVPKTTHFFYSDKAPDYSRGKVLAF